MGHDKHGCEKHGKHEHEHDDDECCALDSMVESEEVFLVVAALVRGASGLDDVASMTGLEPPVAAAVLEDVVAGGIVKTRKRGKKPFTFEIDWKGMAALVAGTAIGEDTEVSLMIEELDKHKSGSYDASYTRAARRVEAFIKDLARDPGFAMLLEQHLKLLVEEYLADDPALYGTTLLDVAGAFEGLLVKAGARELGTKSKAMPGLLVHLKRWTELASQPNLPAELALGQVMQANGLLKK